MWTKISHFILKYRVWLAVLLGIATAYMAYRASEVRTVVKYIKLVPDNDEALAYYNEFTEIFGEDGNVVVVGVDDPTVVTEQGFKQYQSFIQDLQNIDGLQRVIALPNIQVPVKNSRKRRFDLTKVFPDSISSQAELDSLIKTVKSYPFYDGQLYNQESNAYIALLTFKPNFADSTARFPIIKKLEKAVENYSELTGVDVHVAGLPYMRTILSREVQREMTIFLIVSLVVTALVLLFFFRSFSAVFVPLLVIAVAVVWVLGTIVLLGYKISMLTGLIPPIIVVIGIPNCVYLLNKYHQEFSKHGNKIIALSAVIRKIGVVTLITNLTTAIGFFVIIFARISLLKEFGIVAGLNVFSTFFISIILMPTIFSFLPDPGRKHLKHLDFKGVSGILIWLEQLVLNRRKIIYIVTGIIVVASIYGSFKVRAVSFMLDDLKGSHKLKKDIRFFEKSFGGVMPLEIVVDTKDRNAIKKLGVVQKISDLQAMLEAQPQISKTISLVNLVKASRQAYWGGLSNFYGVPTRQDKNIILSHMKKSSSGSENYIKSFADTTGKIRVSAKVADIGSIKMQELVDSVIRPKADSILDVANSDIEYGITGTTLIFIRGNSFLVKNLRESLFIAILAIAVIMGILFRNTRMIILSIATNLIPLLITGALMGYAGIPLKPSTALIFSIAFGIAVDDSIHYLAKFRQELYANNFDVKEAVKRSLEETGASMIYTSIILFFGFIIFAGSSFGGTIMLGILTSVTLLCAMITNLVVLPSLILTFDSGKRSLKFRSAIDDVNELQEDKI